MSEQKAWKISKFHVTSDAKKYVYWYQLLRFPEAKGDRDGERGKKTRCRNKFEKFMNSKEDEKLKWH